MQEKIRKCREEILFLLDGLKLDVGEGVEFAYLNAPLCSSQPIVRVVKTANYVAGGRSEIYLLYSDYGGVCRLSGLPDSDVVNFLDRLHEEIKPHKQMENKQEKQTPEKVASSLIVFVKEWLVGNNRHHTYEKVHKSITSLLKENFEYPAGGFSSPIIEKGMKICAEESGNNTIVFLEKMMEWIGKLKDQPGELPTDEPLENYFIKFSDYLIKEKEARHAVNREKVDKHLREMFRRMYEGTGEIHMPSHWEVIAAAITEGVKDKPRVHYADVISGYKAWLDKAINTKDLSTPEIKEYHNVSQSQDFKKRRELEKFCEMEQGSLNNIPAQVIGEMYNDYDNFVNPKTPAFVTEDYRKETRERLVKKIYYTRDTIYTSSPTQPEKPYTHQPDLAAVADLLNNPDKDICSLQAEIITSAIVYAMTEAGRRTSVEECIEYGINEWVK